MINKEDLLYKMEELSELLDLVREENVNEELFELCYKYRYEIIVCRNMILSIDINNMAYKQYMLVKQAEENINKLYSFRDYIESLTKVRIAI